MLGAVDIEYDHVNSEWKDCVVGLNDRKRMGRHAHVHGDRGFEVTREYGAA